MKALVLAGGRGTRLRPITHTSAKQLVPVANKPVLFYGLEAIGAAGIREVGIVVGDPREMLQPDHRTGQRVTTGEHMSQCRHPDNVVDDVNGIEERREHGRHHDHHGDLVVLYKSRQVSGIRLAPWPGDEEKPKQPRSDLALVGVYLFNASIFDAVRAIRPGRRGELEITDAIQHLISSGNRVRSHVITGWWKDTGKVEDMLEGNRMMLGSLETDIRGVVDQASAVEGRVSIGSGTVVERSRLRGPLIIGANARILDSYVGPFTAIADEVELSHSEIEHSIVLERSKIHDVPRRIESSLIGKDVVVCASDARPRTHRLTLGDSSRVELS